MTYQAYDTAIKKFLLANIHAESNVIDVGCGTGWTGLLLSQKNLHCNVDGVDIDELKVHRANRIFLKAKRDHLVACKTCRAEEASQRFGTHHYDFVVSNHALHHYKDSVKALREMSLLLKPSGKLLLSELEQSYGEKIDDCPRYRSEKIKELVARAGFKIRELVLKPPGVYHLTATH